MTIVTNPKGKWFYCKFYYTDDCGIKRQKLISTGISKYGSKKEAKEIGKRLEEDFLKEIEKKKAKKENSFTRESHSDDNIKDYSEYWLSALKGSVKDNTLRAYRDEINTHIVPMLGKIKISNLTQFDLQTFIEQEIMICDKRKASIEQKRRDNPNAKIQSSERPFYSSISKHIATIKMMLEYAYNDGDVDENVAKKINKQIIKKIPKSTFKSIPYTREEVAILRKIVIGSTIEVPVIIASNLGLRRSETLGLKWNDIDFEQNIIYIRNTCILVGAKPVYRNNVTKNESSCNSLPLLPGLKVYLLSVKEKQEHDKQMFGSGYQDSDYICRKKDGSLISPGYLTRTFHAIIVRNKLRVTRFHDLRHTVGTVILEETGDIKLVSEILRHSTIQTTSDLYIQPGLEYKASGLSKLSFLSGKQ